MRSRSTEGLLYTHIKSAAQETIHSHTPMLKTSLWGKTYRTTRGLPLPPAGGTTPDRRRGREVRQDVPLASTLPRHSPQQTPPHSCQRTTGGVTTVQNDLHGLPVKRKRELCEKLCSTTVFFFWKFKN